MICQLGILLLIGSVSVTTALPQCVCTREQKPVCGSDGQTYNNECLLKCAQSTNPLLTMQSLGGCKEQESSFSGFENNPDCDTEAPVSTSCECLEGTQYVCGNDGATYDNACFLKCASEVNPDLDVLHDGACDYSVKIVD